MNADAPQGNSVTNPRPGRIINVKALLLLLKVIEFNEQAIATAQKLVRAYQLRNHTLMELAQANFTGDKQAWNQIAPMIRDDKYPTHSYYMDEMRTRSIWRTIKEWRKQHDTTGT